jgi:DNA (cytosine-5)-methyltransferase 1
MSVTFVDLFCGAGGSSTGLVEAGYELLLAANHDKIAISTHTANHPTAEHLCKDISQYDMRRLPRADVLWASPICTEISPAGGRKKRRKAPPGQPIIDGFEVSDASMERTRATFWDVLRATEVWRYKAVMCENVVEALDWELFDIWLSGMHRLGYTSQIVSASSAHLGDAQNAPAPQWRDRIYVVFVQEGMRTPDLAPRPAAHCESCGDVDAVQSWRNGRRWGKYRQQYDYRCPSCKRLVEPYVRPASSVIDWSNLGTRIGDRPKPLVDATMARIRAGLAAYPADPTLLTINHSGHDGRAVPAAAAPLASRTAKIGDGVLVPAGAFYVKNYSGRPQDRVRDISDPLGTVTTKRSHSLVVPPQVDDSFVVTLRRNGTANPVSAPLTGVSAGGNHHGLVVPYRRGSAKPASDPMLTLGTRDSAGLVRPAVDIEDCYFRMIQPREQLAAQRFPTDYIVHGNKGEQTMQAGNAVSVNAARWLGARLAPVL